MRNLLVGIATCLMLCSAARGEDRPTYQSLWESVSKSADCKPQDDVDLTIFTCETTQSLWYFTKQGHPAHPGVIKRYVIEDAKGVSIAESGWSFASDDAQPAFKTFLAQIRALDEQMKAAMSPAAATAPEAHIRIEGNWQPQGGDNQAVLSLTARFFALEDGGKYDDAYALMDPGLTGQFSLAQYEASASEVRRSAGATKSRTIKTIDWENNSPLGPPGTYAALDYSAETEKGELCGFVAWRRHPDGFFTLVREETNLLPNSVGAEDLAKLRAQFRCVT